MRKLLLLSLLFLTGCTQIGATRTFVSEQVGDNPQNGYILSTNGATSTWIANSGGPGGGSTTTLDSTEVAFGSPDNTVTSSANFTFNSSTNQLSVSSITSTSVTSTNFAVYSTSTFYNDIVMSHAHFLTAHGIKGDASDGLYITANNDTAVANFGVGNSANSTFNGGVNIDGQTRLATSLTGLAYLTSGVVSATNTINVATGTITGGFFQTGLSTCNADGETLAYNATTGKFECGDDDSGGAASVSVTETLIPYGDVGNTLTSSTSFYFTSSTNALNVDKLLASNIQATSVSTSIIRAPGVTISFGPTDGMSLSMSAITNAITPVSDGLIDFGSSGLRFDDVYLYDLFAYNVTTTNLAATGTLFSNSLSFTNANGTSVTTTNLNWSTALGTSLTLTNGTSTNFFSGGLTFTNLFGTNATTTNLSLAGAFSQTGLGDCSGANQALNYTLSNGDFGCITVTGGTVTGTVTLTQNQIAFGDPSNAVTSSLLFKFSTSTGLLVSITSTLATTTIGAPITVLPNTPLSIGGNTSSYVQVNLQNLSNGTAASGDYVVTSNDGTDTSWFTDFGMNNSQFNQSAFDIMGAHDGYVYTHGNNLAIGTASGTASVIKFFIGGTVSTTEIARFTTSGLQMRLTKGVTTTNLFATTTNFVNATSTNLKVGTLLSYASANGTSITSTNMSFTRANGTSITSTNIASSNFTSASNMNFFTSSNVSSFTLTNNSFLPGSDVIFSLGSNALRFKTLFIDSVSSTNVTTTNLLTKTFSASIRSVSTDQTLNPTSTDYTITVDASGGNRTINLPNTASTTVGRIFNIKKTDSSGNSVFIDAFGTQTIDGNTVRTSTVQYTNVQIQSDGTNWQVL